MTTTYESAREEAEREREEFIARMRQQAAKISAEISDELGLEVRWDDSPVCPVPDPAAA